MPNNDKLRETHLDKLTKLSALSLNAFQLSNVEEDPTRREALRAIYTETVQEFLQEYESARQPNFTPPSAFTITSVPAPSRPGNPWGR